MTNSDHAAQPFHQAWTDKANMAKNSPETTPETPVVRKPMLSPSMTPPSQLTPKTPFWKRRKFLAIVGGVLGVILVFAGVTGAVAYTVKQKVDVIRFEAEQAATEGRAVYASMKTQDLPGARQHLVNAQNHIKEADGMYQQLAWAGNLPIASKYYEDGTHGIQAALAGTDAGLKVLDAIEPHADLLGFKGKGTFAGTTQDRIGVVLDTLNKISPALDSIAVDIEKMQDNLEQIDPEDYPEELRGYPIRQYVTQARGAAEAAEVALNEARPAVERLPEIAGSDKRRKYLVIFQNDNELRPTGGFMTAYAVVFVEKGQVIQEKSDDIYELDKKFSKKPPIPEQLGRFLTTESKWNLRDMNIDPNYKKTMETFYQHYQNVPGEPKDIDGIITIDTVLLEKIVEVLGPIEVPGYGTFSAQDIPACDCPHIIYALSEIIDRPTPYHRENRKGILAPMMSAIIQKTYATERDKWPGLAELIWQGVEGRHLQFYFFNEEDQKAAEAINAAGIIPQMPGEGDYLTVIDANLAGAKSNLFVETSGVQRVNGIENGRLSKEVELTYRNTHAPSNCNLEAGQLCLNGRLNNWTRWYLPKGVAVTEVIGLEEGYKVDSSDPNFDVLEGIFKLDPLGQTKVRVSYTVPYTLQDQYKLTMQKQGGTDDIPYEISTPWGEAEFILNKDQTIEVK